MGLDHEVGTGDGGVRGASHGSDLNDWPSSKTGNTPKGAALGDRSCAEFGVMVECWEEIFSGLRERQPGQGYMHTVGIEARRGDEGIQGQEEGRWA